MTNQVDANRTSSGPELKSELARLCLPNAKRDAGRKLAWINSICILFLVIGVVGARNSPFAPPAPPPLDESVPAMVEPVPVPVTKMEQPENAEQSDPTKLAAPQVVAVAANLPNVNFSVPTVGNLVVPVSIAPAPPPEPMKPVAPLDAAPLTLEITGNGGDRPKPPYPQLAVDLRQQGTVVLYITVDEKGNIKDIRFKKSAGPVLDRSCIEFVRRHWVFPTGAAGRVYEQPFIYTFNR